MSRSYAKWCLLNLSIVSILGVALRYKGVYSLPLVDYKYLLNAHSHFAFAGWVTTALFTALLHILSASGVTPSPVYRYQFWLAQISSFGMLVSFTVQGYGPVSIFFSSLSVAFSYWFSFQFWKDSDRGHWPPLVKACIRLALVFLVLSSAGPFLLAYSMSHAIGDMAFYYNAIYLYLHFQYNGWFTFGVMALFFWAVPVASPDRYGRAFVFLMALACVPAYGLSLLWTDPPAWIWWMAGAAGLLQVGALMALFVSLRRCCTSLLCVLSLVAFSIKLVLQALSVIPSLGRLAFGYRPVVIAYLHLVVLGFVSFFLLGFFLAEGLLHPRGRITRVGLTGFAAGVIANEAVLLGQSILSFAGRGWATAPGWLLGAAMLMCGGVVLFLGGQARRLTPFG